MTSTDSITLVDTPYGQLAGRSAQGVRRFLGVPYAAPPTDGLRLASPRKLQPWVGVRDAGQPGHASLQRLSSNQTWLYEPPASQSEDCLTLNIWSPEGADKLPVMLWLHGGATRNGYAHAAVFDGQHLARRQGIVVVTVGYRLGALGGLAHPDLHDDETGLCANWGLQDKLAAMAWVSEAIAAFGGDAQRVTLAGQSSGAANIALIAQNGLGRGLFTQAILQSPPLFRPPMFAELDDAAQYTERVAAELGCRDVRALRLLDGAQIQAAERELAMQPVRMPGLGRPATAPVRDGQLLRHWSYDGPATNVPTMVGWTSGEADFWFLLHDEQGRNLAPLPMPTARQELLPRIDKLLGQHYAFSPAPTADDVLQHYTGEPADIWRALYTDLVFRAPILQWASRQSAAGQPTYAYAFAWALPAPNRGAPHAMDVPFVFGTTGQPRLANRWQDADFAMALSRQLQARWGHFVHHGQPGHGWPRLDPLTPQLCVFDADGAQVRNLPEPAALDAWPAYRSLLRDPVEETAARSHAQLRDSAAQACALLKLLANEDRLLLLCELLEGEKNVSELQELTGIRQPTLSQQLGALRQDAVVAVRKEGKYVYYRLVCPNTRSLMASLSDLYCRRR